MATLTLRPASECRWDCVALGEVMLRFDPEFGRVRTTRHFRVSEGGGEYNVARALRKVFGLRTAIVTAIVDNELGHLLEDLMLTGGTDLSHVQWVAYDGMGRSARLGLNFTEKGYGIRSAKGVSDRAHTAISQLRPGDIDWNRIFVDEGVRWFHTGGIMAGLSESTAEVVVEAITAAREAGTVVSYDLNYRESLWRERGGRDEAVRVNGRIAPLVDVMFGNEEDFTAALGFAVADLDDELTELDPANFEKMIAAVVERYPNLRVVGTTLRDAKTANVNGWGGVLWAGGAFVRSRTWESLEIYDRVGGGDGFASGVAYAFLTGKDPAAAVEYGAAHGALVMTTPGDTSMATTAEVERAIAAKTARVAR